MSIVTYGIGQNSDTIDYAVVYGFGVVPLFDFTQPPLFVNYIPEELRASNIMFEDRMTEIVESIRADLIKFENRTTCVLEEEERLDSVEFEDRIIVLPYKEEN